MYIHIVTEYRTTSAAKVFVVFNSDAYAWRMRLRNSASFALNGVNQISIFSLKTYLHDLLQ